MPRAFKAVSADLAWDGALRDFYIEGVNPAGWNRFIDAVPTIAEAYEFQVDGTRRDLPASFAEITLLQRGTSTTLSLQVGGKPVNCHFFSPSEIELDFWPSDYNSPESWGRLVGFFQQLVDLVGKRGIITHENAKDAVIDEIRPQAVG
jgi:hypothetical protein